jgi:hypothetical protein
MKNETRIEEPSSLLDSWHKSLVRAPLTPDSNPSEVALIIDFKNECFSQFEAMHHLY